LDTDVNAGNSAKDRKKRAYLCLWDEKENILQVIIMLKKIRGVIEC
jgi:hypothetical protein